MNTDGTIMQFLQGSHSFDGVWFGDDHPEHKGKFWWRKFLPRESPAPAKTAEEVEKAILDAADEHGFRVPYDGSNKFYDETAVKSFISGAKWMQDCTALRTQPSQTGCSRQIIEFLQSLTYDPYPEDVFLPIPTNVLEMIHSTLMEEYKMPIDRLTGHIGRILRKPISEQASQLLSMYPEGQTGCSREDIENYCNKIYPLEDPKKEMFHDNFGQISRRLAFMECYDYLNSLTNKPTE